MSIHIQKTEPFTLVIFGATGDLSKRKLFPALFMLFKNGLLNSDFTIVGVGRSERTAEKFRMEVRDSINQFARLQVTDESQWNEFASRFFYAAADVNNPVQYQGIKKTVEEREQALGVKGKGNRLFYLAIAPDLFATVSLNLKKSGLTETAGWKRLIIEKPIGHDYSSAKVLNEQIKQSFTEKETYRIDHYLGKEMVQNIEVLRFANSLFEPLWSHHFIESVQITASETVGVEDRANYYDEAGALRDMVQNHILQMLMMVCMEPPSRLKTEAIHDEKVKVLRSLRRYQEDEIGNYVVRGQYVTGVINGKQVPAYRDEKNVNPESRTETFVAARLYVDNLRWAGVPFYIRTGKRMAEKATEIVIQFKEMPKNLYFNKNNDLGPNLLVISIHPMEGMYMTLNAKKPGSVDEITPVAMEFCNNCEEGTPEAYESLLHDAIIGDQTFFTHWEEVSLAWKFIDPIRRTWDQEKAPMEFYESGSWGPQAAHELLAGQGHKWWPISTQRRHRIVRAREMAKI
ncbi:glucose-6-phosphate dehydrogenase [Paenactinomyces guangxiensis]|uniref:Glucose-6-phosphate 1-dehydrogenase n=1 Tax=Paenactinomyces guangxiensis TaxID=1490290 RepID=A0A7W2A8K9_9BACL|nr:glucose-6-phosphate dehydrogenase [Paenactinomyces guangxiensis]MBA4495721.1 glucose-6-phosphate dehydrogenase [Paenactinomyces guangxiensis]MBH8592710.1 glucose-6-phosphate dehydrogenase [Paenactinomyces guangxiensis]